MSHEKILVTPEIAKGYLAKKSNFQRAISNAIVDRYAESMKRGEWLCTPTHCVGISSDGFIVDGQHRLSAVVRSGCSVEMWVMRDAPPEIFSVIDQGRIRNVAQIAKMRGLKHTASCELAAVAALAWQPGSGDSQVERHALSKADVLALTEHHSDALDVVFPAYYSGVSQIRIAPFRGALLRIAISRPDYIPSVSDFVRIVANGFCPDELLTNMNSDMPLKLRNYLQRRNMALVGEKIQAFWTTFKAFDHARAGTTIKYVSNLPTRPSEWPTSHRYPIYLDSKPSDVSVSEWIKVKGQ
jgi:hypothetical protein